MRRLILHEIVDNAINLANRNANVRIRDIRIVANAFVQKGSGSTRNYEKKSQHVYADTIAEKNHEPLMRRVLSKCIAV